MDEKNVFGTDFWSNYLRKRGLDSDCPALKPYLRPGLDVLDVGCGAGSITMDVAKVVQPGSVVGVDSTERLINEANAWAEHSQVRNVRFQVGDAYQLDFGDGTFDISYSHAVLSWLADPVRALIEQKRITKPGGLVLASLSDWGTFLIYPACPAFEAVIRALRCLNQPAADIPLFENRFLGRELLALFCQAGFQQSTLTGAVHGSTLCYAGSEALDGAYRRWQSSLLGSDGRFAQELKRRGAVDEATLQAARQELDAWHDSPYAFWMVASVSAAGRVP